MAAILRLRDENGNVYAVPAIRGEKGDAGYTPVKGTDYFTDADKEELLNELATETKFQLLIDHTVDSDSGSVTFTEENYPNISNVKEWILWLNFGGCTSKYTSTWLRALLGSKVDVPISSTTGSYHMYSWHKEVGGVWASSFGQSSNDAANQKIASPAMVDISPYSGFVPQYYEDYSSIKIYGADSLALPAGTKIKAWGRV